MLIGHFANVTQIWRQSGKKVWFQKIFNLKSFLHKIVYEILAIVFRLEPVSLSTGQKIFLK